jgi:hypothetical protein
MVRQDEGNSADGGLGGNPSERSSRNRDTSNWSGAPPSTAPAGKPHNRNQPPAPPSSPESVEIEQVSRSNDLQFKLADLYARENFSDGAPFDETYLLLNQRELAKAFLEKHKKEFAQLYLAHHYAKENGLDLAYVDQYPEQLAQNYMMGHALELARGYVTEHRVQLAEEFLASNQMDLAQSFVEEHQLDLAQRYVSEYTERLVALMDGKRAQAALAKLRQATPAQGAVQAAVQPAVQATEQVPPNSYIAPQAPAASVAAGANDVLADLPTMAILTKKTAEYSSMSSGQAVTEEMPISNYRPMPRLRPRRRTTTTQLPLMNPGQANPAAPGLPAAPAQQPAVSPALPEQPLVPAQVAQTQQLPLYQALQSSYQSVQASDSSSGSDAGASNQTSSYASQSSRSSASPPPASPLESYAPPATAESSSGASSSASFSAAESEPYLRASAVGSQSSESAYTGHEAPSSPLANEPILPDSEASEPRRPQSNAPPPLSGDYTNDARNAVLWDQLGQVPLSTDGSIYGAAPPVSAGSGFNSLTPPAWENAGLAYQSAARSQGAVPMGMEDFMSTLSESAISAQAIPAKGLARFGSPPPSLRSDGAATEVTSAWF